MKIRLLPGTYLLCVLLASSGCQRSSQADTVDAYTVRLAVTPAADGRLQRVQLPIAAYTSSQQADLTDVRIFDRSGKRLPIALVDDRLVSPARKHTADVRVYPIVGPLSALKLTGVSLRIAEHGEARLVGASGVIGSGGRSVIGTLLDTRAIDDPATSIVLNADYPAQQAVTILLESGPDLQNWRPLAQKVLFRSEEANEPLGTASIDLPSVKLKRQYVRVTWSGVPTASVKINGAEVGTSTSPLVERQRVRTTAPRLVNGHDIRFALPFRTKLDAIRLTPAATEGVVPVRMFGRNAPEEPWQLLTAGVMYSSPTQRADANRNTLELGGTSYKSYKIEADARSAGFSSAPDLELLLRTSSLIVLFNSSGPFTFAAGSSEAPDIFLSTKELTGSEDVDLSTLPVATVSTGPGNLVTLTNTEGDRGAWERTAFLWAVLAVGAAVLLFAALTLFRKSSQTS